MILGLLPALDTLQLRQVERRIRALAHSRDLRRDLPRPPRNGWDRADALEL